MWEAINQSTAFLKNSTGFAPEIAIILGTGLGAMTRKIEIEHSIPFDAIPGFVNSTVESHQGRLIFGHSGHKKIVAMQGRLHFYEGYSQHQVTFPIRVFKQLGVKTLLLSNAAGGINPDFEVGDLMIIEDHINLIPNPLIGPHHEAYGERFPDLSEPYSKTLIRAAEKIARENLMPVKKGCYIAVTGPTYETPAEYRYLRTIGGDAVGMSTVPEVIVARQAGISCFAVSIITDLGIPGKIEQLFHKDVISAAEQAEPQLEFLLSSLIAML